MRMTAWFQRFRRRGAEQKRKDALAGKATSGHLSPGERQRLFRQRSK